MSIGSSSNITGTTTLSNHPLNTNTYETVTVTIAYSGSTHADGSFYVDFGNIELEYRTIDEPIVVSTAESFEIVELGKTLNTLALNDEIRIGNETFAYLSSSDTTVTLFAKYNLNVGSHPYGGTATNMQDFHVLGIHNSEYTDMYGGVLFHSTSDVSFPADQDIDLSTYDINQYLINYKNILESMSGISGIGVSLMGFNEVAIICPGMVCNLPTNTSFWTKASTATDKTAVWMYIPNQTDFTVTTLKPTADTLALTDMQVIGVRPVITVPKSAFE